MSHCGRVFFLFFFYSRSTFKNTQSDLQSDFLMWRERATASYDLNATQLLRMLKYGSSAERPPFLIKNSRWALQTGGHYDIICWIRAHKTQPRSHGGKKSIPKLIIGNVGKWNFPLRLFALRGRFYFLLQFFFYSKTSFCHSLHRTRTYSEVICQSRQKESSFVIGWADSQLNLLYSACIYPSGYFIDFNALF